MYLCESTSAAAVLIVSLGFGDYAVGVSHEAAFVLYTFVICGLYIVVDTILLRSLKAYHQHLYGDMATVRLEQDALLRQEQQTMAAAERLYLANNLHDGLPQSLTGVALHLATVPRLLEQKPLKVRERLRNVQLLVAEQQERYCLMQVLQPSPAALSETPFALAPHLEWMVSLGGDCTIDSTATRVCLSMTVPLGRPGAHECQFAS